MPLSCFTAQALHAILNALWFGLLLNVLVNNFSVMLGRCHRFLGIITSTFWGVNMSCSRTQHGGDPSGARTHFKCDILRDNELLLH